MCIKRIDTHTTCMGARYIRLIIVDKCMQFSRISASLNWFYELKIMALSAYSTCMDACILDRFQNDIDLSTRSTHRDKVRDYCVALQLPIMFSNLNLFISCSIKSCWRSWHGNWILCDSRRKRDPRCINKIWLYLCE